MHILGRLDLKFKYTFTQGRTESAEPGEMCMCASQRTCVHAQSWGPYTHGCVRCQCYISMLGTVAHLYKLEP